MPRPRQSAKRTSRPWFRRSGFASWKPIAREGWIVTVLAVAVGSAGFLLLSQHLETRDDVPLWGIAIVVVTTGIAIAKSER